MNGLRNAMSPTKRGELVRLLVEALTAAEELGDAATAYLIERAVDEARAQQFRLSPG